MLLNSFCGLCISASKPLSWNHKIFKVFFGFTSSLKSLNPSLTANFYSGYVFLEMKSFQVILRHWWLSMYYCFFCFFLCLKLFLFQSAMKRFLNSRPLFINSEISVILIFHMWYTYLWKYWLLITKLINKRTSLHIGNIIRYYSLSKDRNFKMPSSCLAQ